MQENMSPLDDGLTALDEDFGLWLHLVRTKDVIHHARREELWQGGISSSAEAGILFLVRDLGDRATPAEISRHLFKRSHGISMLISRMEKKGLVKKVKDLERKNLVRVEMTERGQKAHQYAAQLESIHNIMSVLSKQERRQLDMSLNKLCKKAAGMTGIDNALLERTLPLGY